MMAKDLVISIIHLYQHMNRALVQFRFPLVAWTGCRQWPTCSDYAVVAIRERGLARGGYAATRRFLRCNPLIRAA